MPTKNRHEIDRHLRRALTVADLIAQLEEFEPDARVVFACDYGDICHTMQALPVRGVDEREVRDLSESAYSHSGLALDDEEDEFRAYCETCDDYFAYVGPCPACGGKLMDEDGYEVTAEEEAEDDVDTIVVLEM